MATFPSVFSSFPQPTATSKLNSPSHSALHNQQSSAIGQLEAVVGLNGNSSAIGTLTYMVESPDSNGGGHVQTANKGGTGQTAFTKGDILVATSSSVLSKLASPSVVGQVLTSDPNQAAGLYWAQGNASTKIYAVQSTVATVAPTVLYATSILGSTLGSSNAIKYTMAIDSLTVVGGSSVVCTVQYGNNTWNIFSNTGIASVSGGYLEGYLFANGVSNQAGEIRTWLYPTYQYTTNAASVNSAATQDFIVRANVGTQASVQTRSFLIEKIA